MKWRRALRVVARVGGYVGGPHRYNWSTIDRAMRSWNRHCLRAWDKRFAALPPEQSEAWFGIDKPLADDLPPSSQGGN